MTVLKNKHFYAHLLIIGIENIKYTDAIGKAINSVFTEEPINEQVVIDFLSCLCTLKNKGDAILGIEDIFKGFAKVIEKYVGNKTFCTKILDIYDYYHGRGIDGKHEFYKRNYFTSSLFLLKDKLEIIVVNTVIAIINKHIDDLNICKVGCRVLRDMFSRGFTSIIINIYYVSLLFALKR